MESADASSLAQGDWCDHNTWRFGDRRRLPALLLAHHHVGPTRTSLVTYLLPCTALLWGALLLNEHITWNAIAGLALVLLGTMLTNGTITALFRRKRRRPVEPAADDGASEVVALRPVAD